MPCPARPISMKFNSMKVDFELCLVRVWMGADFGEMQLNGKFMILIREFVTIGVDLVLSVFKCEIYATVINL